MESGLQKSCTEGSRNYSVAGIHIRPKSKVTPGYIKGYVPGVRENGGQYTMLHLVNYGFAQIGR